MVYIILALIFYTAAIMFGTLASRSANTNMVTGIMNAFSAIIPIAIAVPLINKKMLISSKQGILMAVISGLALAFFTMAINKSYSINKVAIVAPIVLGGAIFSSAILSSIFFKEKIDFIQGVGLFFLAIGLSLIIYARAVAK